MNPLQRLYKTKLALLATVSTVAGLALLLLARWAEDGVSWLIQLPLSEIGATLFATGLIVIAFEYVDREDAEERALLRLRTLLKEEAPAFRDAVVEGFATKPDSLTRVASPETLDEIVRNCLASRFGDRQLAEGVYADLSEQLVRTEERRHDVNVSVALTPWEHGPVSGRGSMFVATIRWEYRVVPSASVLRFSCVSDIQEYGDALKDPTSTASWYFQPIDKLTAASPEAFELLEVTVDGVPQRIRRTTRKSAQVYEASLDSSIVYERREVTVAYSYRVLVQRNSHLLHLDISRPAKGLKVQFWYGDCGIRRVNVVDYIASAQPVRISQTPASDPSPNVDIGFDGWVLPKAGVAFVWVLENELNHTANTAAKSEADLPTNHGSHR
jgi:hypothetical protein